MGTGLEPPRWASSAMARTATRLRSLTLINKTPESQMTFGSLAVQSVPRLRRLSTVSMRPFSTPVRRNSGMPDPGFSLLRR